MSVAIALGLLAALFYGATDFLARFAGRSVGTLRTLCYGHGFAAAGLGLVVLRTGVPHVSHGVWALLLLSNLTGLAATVFLYRALATGAMAVVSPIVASYGAISAVLSALAGEVLRPMAWAGLALAFAGGVVAARAGGGSGAGRAGMREAVASALLYGVSLWLQGDFLVPVLGFWLPVWTYYALGFVVTLAWAGASGASLAMPAGRAAPLVLGTTVLACGGTVALAAGQATGAVATVTVLSALASAVTVGLARLLLKESVTTAGWAGLAMIVSGLALLRAV